MKDQEETKATSTIQRLIKERTLTEETYTGLMKKRFKTAQDRRIYDFNRLLTDGKKEAK